MKGTGQGKGLWVLGIGAAGIAAYFFLTRKKWWKDYETWDGAIISSKGNIVKITAGVGAHPSIIYRIPDYKSFIGKRLTYGVWVLVPRENAREVYLIMHATPTRIEFHVPKDGGWHWVVGSASVPADVTELDCWIINTGAGGTGSYFYVANPRLVEGASIKATPEPGMPTF